MFFRLIKKYPLNIAHRGARSLAPENTLLAARRAINVGADVWEIDVQLTADGEPVVVHDNTLGRTSDVGKMEGFSEREPWFVHQFTLAELRTLSFGEWFVEEDPFGQIAAGMINKKELAIFKETSILELWDALVFSKNSIFRIDVEIKNLTGLPGHDRVVEKVVEQVEELKMTDGVLISSSNLGYLREVKALNSDITTGLIADSPHPDPAGLLHDLGAEAYHLCWEMTDADMVSLLRDKGFHVNVWTVNDETSLKKCLKAGVSGIFTDFPQLLTVSSKL